MYQGETVSGDDNFFSVLFSKTSQFWANSDMLVQSNIIILNLKKKNLTLQSALQVHPETISLFFEVRGNFCLT